MTKLGGKSVFVLQLMFVTKKKYDFNLKKNVCNKKKYDFNFKKKQKNKQKQKNLKT